MSTVEVTDVNATNVNFGNNVSISNSNNIAKVDAGSSNEY